MKDPTSEPETRSQNVLYFSQIAIQLASALPLWATCTIAAAAEAPAVKRDSIIFTNWRRKSSINKGNTKCYTKFASQTKCQNPIIITMSSMTSTALVSFAPLFNIWNTDNASERTRYAVAKPFETKKNLFVEVSRLSLQTNKLREKGERTVGCTNGNGAPQGSNSGHYPHCKIDFRKPFIRRGFLGCTIILGGLTNLANFVLCVYFLHFRVVKIARESRPSFFDLTRPMLDIFPVILKDF
ncbi:pectin lyase-like superfamily protein [Striga asiatica]|uniref:Pectin lyase-like superfamily protein n=1 Tax=Striga asiatica TaxID=4170 RepID=A0A5A7QLG5_STRAF|nr:pectin lyase-like superfamily protein [Striga asiatica]